MYSRCNVDVRRSSFTYWDGLKGGHRALVRMQRALSRDPMHSKQKSRTKPAKQKKNTRARTGSRRSTNVIEAKAGNVVPRLQITRAPLAASGRLSRFFGLKFDRASPHDEFPEGGLRITGVLPGSISTSTLTSDLTNYGLWANGAGSTWALVTPCGSLDSVGSNSQNLFSGSGPLSGFAQWFRRFRFRKLSMLYNGRQPVSSVDNRVCQVSYERDAFMAETNPSYTTAVNSTTVRFNSWEPNVQIPIIDQTRSDKADELWYCTAQNDTIAGGSTLSRILWQGAISAMGDAPATPADITLGQCMFSFTIDLYGFTNQSEGVLPQLKAEKVEKKLPPDHDFVELRTPRVETKTQSRSLK